MPVGSGRENALYDHTTLIKTILLAFARNPATALAKLPGRVQRAPRVSRAPDGAGQPVMLTDFQSDRANLALTARRPGLES